jgi:hypothetical protein
MKFIARSSMVLYSSRSVITVITHIKNRYAVQVAGMVIERYSFGGLVKKEDRSQLENLDTDGR